VSWQAADWLDRLPYESAKPLATRVLLKLANVAAQDGTRAWRSNWEMADELGVDRRSIQRALRELQDADLIRPGDQRAVGHIPPNRRPTVYDLNFGWHRMYAQPEIPLPDAGDEDLPDAYDGPSDLGATQFPTGSLGATSGATTGVALGTKRTTYLTTNEEPYVGNRAQAHEGSEGQSPRSSGEAFDLARSVQQMTTPSAAVCPNAKGRRPHTPEPSNPRYCRDCGDRIEEQLINAQTGEVA
jgi:hypothetical protein